MILNDKQDKVLSSSDLTLMRMPSEMSQCDRDKDSSKQLKTKVINGRTESHRLQGLGLLSKKSFNCII